MAQTPWSLGLAPSRGLPEPAPLDAAGALYTAPLPLNLSACRPRAIGGVFLWHCLTVARTGALRSAAWRMGSPDLSSTGTSPPTPAGHVPLRLRNLALLSTPDFGRGCQPAFNGKVRERRMQPRVSTGAGQRWERPRLIMTTWGL